jgi:hypothetical protein
MASPKPRITDIAIGGQLDVGRSIAKQKDSFIAVGNDVHGHGRRMVLRTQLWDSEAQFELVVAFGGTV